jgi:hypothetical protein
MSFSTSDYWFFFDYNVNSGEIKELKDEEMELHLMSKYRFFQKYLPLNLKDEQGIRFAT